VYNITNIDGVKINKDTKRFPVEVVAEQHAINGPEHTGILDLTQLPQDVMFNSEHQLDPHTMIIDGRDISADGSKLDTIESGAEVNNLTDQQAQSLTSGSHSSWHNHDTWYYRKNELQTPGSSQVNWNNITSTPLTYPSSPHIHDDRYFTESEITTNYYTNNQLNNGQLDTRYYTESESNLLLANKSDTSHLHDDRYFTEGEITILLSGKSDTSHLHDDRYFTEGEITTLLSGKSDISHLHDDRYYTENEIDANIYTKTQLDNGQLDSRYFTETEITTNYYTKTQLNNGQLDTRYYTESEIDSMISLAAYGIKGAVDTVGELPIVDLDPGDIYIVRAITDHENEGFWRWDGVQWNFLAQNTGAYLHDDMAGLDAGNYHHLTASQYSTLTSIGNATSLHMHDDRYFTEGEITSIISNYSLSTHLHDDRYYTENEIDTNIYTKSQLNNGQLDTRYYTESEIDVLIEAASFGIKGSVNTLAELPTTGVGDGDVYIVKAITDLNNEGFYKWVASSSSWQFLSPNTGPITHNMLYGLNQEPYWHLNQTQLLGLIGGTNTDASIYHNHDTRYYTKTNMQTSGSALLHWDNLTNKPLTYPATTHIHDDRYFTESEITTNYYSKNNMQASGQALLHWDNLTNKPIDFTPSTHTHDDRYYTETEIDTNIYTKSNMQTSGSALLHWDNLTNKPLTYPATTHIHDDRYYTESESDAKYSILTHTHIKSNITDFNENDYVHKSGDETINGNKTFNGSVTFNGTIISVNSETITLADNIILLNSNYIGSAPTENAGIEIERGSVTSASLIWDEGIDKWKAGLLGSEIEISLLGHIHDDRYFTEGESDVRYSSISHLHDDRYYTETEITTNYYSKANMQTAGQSQLHWDNITNKPDLSGASHNHDDRYFTEIETTSLLSGKSDTSHLHDDRYYTEGEMQTAGQSQLHWDNITSKPSTYPATTHLHDDRYYTETEIDANIYTKSNMQTSGSAQLHWGNLTNKPVDFTPSVHTHSTGEIISGILPIIRGGTNNDIFADDRFIAFDGSKLASTDYSQSSFSLSTHLHDDRYYTEGEVDSIVSNYSLSTHLHDDRYYTKSELNSGQLDSRYYIETEVDTLLGEKINKVSPFTTNNFVLQTSDGQLSDAGVNISSFAPLAHTHSADNLISGTLPLIRGGTNNTTYTSARFIAFDGTRLSSTAYSNSSFAAASHSHSTTNITSGTLPIVRGGTNATAFTTNKFIIFNGTSLIASTYDQVSFSLSNHTHIKSNITDFIEGDYVHKLGDETISGNKTFTGNIDIQGTLTTINSADLSVSDNEIILNAGETGSGITSGYSGLVIDRGALDDAIFRFDETDDKWKIGIGSSLLGISTTDHLHDDRYFTEGEITSLLSGKSDISHLHDGRYYTEGEVDTLFDDYYTKVEIDNNIYTKIESNSLFSVLGHSHNDLYYTESESNAKYSLLTHLHDDRYYTESESDVLLNNKSDISHLHDDRYYTESEMQTSGSAQLHWDNLTNKPLTYPATTHTHDDRYYTETELNNGQLDNRYFTESEITSIVSNYSLSTHLHDDRYYTESEMTSFLSGKSNTSHLHDDRYFTEIETTSFLSGKSDTTHLHDDRYFTESEITSSYYNKTQIDTTFALYYTKSQLDNGQLDSRYYTETELNNGQLDNRYFTESEITTNYYTKTQLNAGQLNNLYYTKNNLNNGGAALIGINPIVDMSAANVQGALEELNTKLSNASSTLQDAYDNGKDIITTQAVKLDSSASTSSPLELTNRTASPSTNLNAGQIAVIDNELYIYDGGRSKWLTPSKTLLFGKDGSVDGAMLRPVGDSATSTTGYRMAKNGTVMGVTLQSNSNISKNVYLRINGSNAYIIGVVNGVFNSSLNVDFSANDVISIYVDPTGPSLSEVVSVLEFGWRK